MRRFFKAMLPVAFVRWIGNILASAGGTYLRRSYSQEGEDLLLERVFDGQKFGFYVDVGAHHPRRFSNTCRFYNRGWQGINIEPNPEALKLFLRRRRRDINVGYGVAEQQGQMSYFMFNEPALNSFDRALSEQRQGGKYRIIDTRAIEVRPLSDILQEFLPKHRHIDFMSIDVEGYDLQALKSNDWTRFRPSCLLVESADFDLTNPGSEPIHCFLNAQNYALFAKTFNTLLYLDRASDAAIVRKNEIR